MVLMDFIVLINEIDLVDRWIGLSIDWLIDELVDTLTRFDSDLFELIWFDAICLVRLIDRLLVSTLQDAARLSVTRPRSRSYE